MSSSRHIVTLQVESMIVEETQGHSKPKKHLKFSALLSVLQSAFENITDKRDPGKSYYSLADVYKCAFAMFFFQDKSLLEFQKQLENKHRRHNLNTVYQVKDIPEDTQLRDIIDIHSHEPIVPVFKELYKRLQRGKYLTRFRFLKNSYLVSMDGSGYFSSNKIQCQKCLRKNHSNGTTTYEHQILQATIVHPDMKQVIPLAPEFIRNGDGKEKQDCEINAGKRLLRKIRKDHPHLQVIFTSDSLYSKQPFVEELKELSFSFILTAKENDHKNLYSDVESLRISGLLDSKTEKRANKTWLYQWVNDVYLNAGNKSPLVNFVQLSIRDSKGKITYKNAWITNRDITEHNVKEIVRGGRARWKIENECFNTLKNQGYHIDHNYGHGKNNLSETLFLLNLLAFFFHQIFQLSDTLYQSARNTFSAQTEYWNTIRIAFRLIVFDSWEDLLERINSPPDIEKIKKNRY